MNKSAQECTDYAQAGVDTKLAERGLQRIIQRVRKTWPQTEGVGAVKLDIGQFANVIDIGNGLGLCLTTDGVGTKALVAQMLEQYDTIGIDCVAMNVNDAIYSYCIIFFNCFCN